MITTYGMMSGHTNMEPELRVTSYKLRYELVFRHVPPDKKIMIKSIELVSPDGEEIEVVVYNTCPMAVPNKPYFVGSVWDTSNTPCTGWVVEFGLRMKGTKRPVPINWESDRIRVEWEVS